jgi:molybdopterin molybdotransferase
MITLEEAWSRIDSAVKCLPPARVPLDHAVGGLVAEDIIAPIDVPGFPSSSMDGIAIRIADVNGDGPWRLPIQTVIAAGPTEPPTLKEGHACKIMTGAPLPQGADTVIKIEDVEIESDRVVFSVMPRPGEFVRPLGNDMTAGQVIFKEGEVLRAADIGILASLGMTDVPIVSMPRIALISTGPEIVAPGETLQYGQIYDANLASLYSLLADDGFPVGMRERVTSNDRDAFQKTFRLCLDSHDLVVSTGGVSMGDYDFIPEVVKSMGGEILFHKLAVKPGKPTLIASLGSRWLISLPGNPVSAVVGYHLYVKRIISLLCGIPYERRVISATLGNDLTISGNRFMIIGARVERSENRLVAYSAARQESGRLSSLRGINGLIMTDGGSRKIAKGETVVVEIIDTRFNPCTAR